MIGLNERGYVSAWRGLASMLFAALITVYATPAAALQVLEAADHAELTAEVSANEVNRIALDGDRVARVIQSPGGFTVEHDAVQGDLYLYPRGSGGSGETTPAAAGLPMPVVLYLGTERGFTYRLSLSVVSRESAQILIRNTAVADSISGDAALVADGYPNEPVALIRAVARREPVRGYVIVPAPTVVDPPRAGSLIEVWRGPRFTARVFRVRANGTGDASTLADLAGRPMAAAWLSAPGSGPNGERLAVVVDSHVPTDTAR